MARIIDVAREAGVSRTTVSRYINKNIELPTATGARIDAAIKRLNYRPNLLAKSLSTGRSDLIGGRKSTRLNSSQIGRASCRERV